MELTKYTNYLKKKNLASTTIKNYLQFYRKFPHKTLTNTNLQNYFRGILTKYEAGTLKLMKEALKSYSKFKKLKLDWERISWMLPKLTKKFFNTIKQEELIQLKKVRFEKEVGTWQRNNLIFDFLFYTGLRISELVNVKHSDWQGKSIRILGKGNKMRYVFCPKWLASHFQPNSADYLFLNQQGGKLTPIAISQMIKKRVKRAGIEKNITPHSFRRSFATLLNNKGTTLTTIQKLLGHSNIETTSNYIHNDYDYLYQDYSKLWKGGETSERIIG